MTPDDLTSRAQGEAGCVCGHAWAQHGRVTKAGRCWEECRCVRVPSGSDDHWLARVKAQAETFEAERDALAAQHTALLGRGRAHVASLVEFARTAPTQEAEYEATMTARLIEHIIGDADEDGCGPCAALAVDGAGE